MPNYGDRFRDAIYREIESWGLDIEVERELKVGYRFVNNPRVLDLVLRHNARYLGIEAKLQIEDGTAYQKLSYTIEDCRVCPIPTIIAFCGAGIKDDMKAKLVASGIGLELRYYPGDTPQSDRVEDPQKLFRQRVYIELGMNWFPLFNER